jgi:hypothetical protein
LGNYSRKTKQNDPTEYLNKVTDRYVFNPSSGLYEGKTELTEAQSKKNIAGANHKRRFFVDVKRDWLAVVMTAISLVLFGYTIHYARLQWTEMSKTTGEAKRSADEAHNAVAAATTANTQAKEAFIKDQRPYLAQTSKSTEPPQLFPNSKMPGIVQIVWNWHITNYGKTPASDIVMSQEMSLGDKPYLPSYGGDGKKGGKSHDIGAAQPPNGETFDTVISAPMKQEEAQKIFESENGVSFRVKISYRDLAGNSYESAICMRRTNAGSIAYCKHDNYIR